MAKDTPISVSIDTKNLSKKANTLPKDYFASAQGALMFFQLGLWLFAGLGITLLFRVYPVGYVVASFFEKDLSWRYLFSETSEFLAMVALILLLSLILTVMARKLFWARFHSFQLQYQIYDELRGRRTESARLIVALQELSNTIKAAPMPAAGGEDEQPYEDAEDYFGLKGDDSVFKL